MVAGGVGIPVLLLPVLGVDSGNVFAAGDIEAVSASLPVALEYMPLVDGGGGADGE